MHIKKTTAIFTGFLFLLIYTFSSCQEEDSGEIRQEGDQQADRGRQVYRMFCVSCHGADGTLQIGGATDLKHSTLERGEVKDAILTGPGNMPPFRSVLSEEDLIAVTNHTISLRE